MKFTEAAELSEDQARKYLEELRWPDGPKCAHCKSANVTRLEGKATRPGVLKCRSCRKQFTVTVGTIFERSHIPLKRWVMGFCLVCASKKGISSVQLQRMLDLKSYKSAWHMAHRIRHAMNESLGAKKLKGAVESDETWVGPRLRGKGKGLKVENKTAVMALVQRDGDLRTRVIERVTKKNLRQSFDEIVDPKTDLMTDELQAYSSLGKLFRSHQSVKHSAGEYSRGPVHVNNAESFFALLKRGVHGSFHHVGKQHLHPYCDESSFRWNHRKIDDCERVEAALKQTQGKRLFYRKPVAA